VAKLTSYSLRIVRDICAGHVEGMPVNRIAGVGVDPRVGFLDLQDDPAVLAAIDGSGSRRGWHVQVADQFGAGAAAPSE
jgi:hypothetical protein